jgi:hypothetical protein
MTNLAFEPGHAGTVEEMRGELLNWLISTTRPATVLGVSNHARFASNQTIVRYKCQVNLDGKIHPQRLLGATTKNYL